MEKKLKIRVITSHASKFMKTSKCKFFIASVAMIMAFSSCLDDKGNSTNFETLGYVASDYPYTSMTIEAFNGDVYSSPELKFEDVGKYGFFYLYLDYDNQPVGAKNYTVSLRGWSQIDKYRLSNYQEMDSYNDSIKSIAPILAIIDSDKTGFLPENNLLYFDISQTKEKQDQVNKYYMVCKRDSLDKDGNPSVYLGSQKTIPGKEGSKGDYSVYAAFDVSDLVREFKKDGKVKFNLFYQKGTKNGEAVFAEYVENPIKLQLPKE
ncbi:hypothetical protein AwDysgo_18520 [Bacteroidales bacterium]|nr:hypothetical protein AwDysgo_18520 [Bacteroidales bacterium]